VSERRRSPYSFTVPKVSALLGSAPPPFNKPDTVRVVCLPDSFFFLGGQGTSLGHADATAVSPPAFFFRTSFYSELLIG